MDNLIIFGAYGFIGFNFLLETVDFKYKVFCVDDPNNYACANYRKSFSNINCDMLNKKEISEQFSGHRIFENKTHFVNFIGASHNDRAILDPSIFQRTNVEAIENIGNLFNEFPNKGKLIHLSTDEVYGQVLTPERKFYESQTPEPQNPYSKTKYEGERLLKTLVPESIILRPSNQYGRFQFPEKLIPHNIERAIHKKKLVMYSEGNQFRSWTPVEYTTKVIKNLLESNKTDLYNISYPDPSFIVSNKVLLEYISNYFWGSVSNNNYDNIIKIKDPRGDLHDFGYSLDTTNLQQEDWYKDLPTYNFFEYLNKTIEFYKTSERFKRVYNSRSLQDFFKTVYGELE